MQIKANALTKTLVWTVGMVTQSTEETRERMALAHKEAQDLVAGIPKENGSARPRIETCFRRSDAYRAVDDVACVGWVLTAIQERVNESRTYLIGASCGRSSTNR